MRRALATGLLLLLGCGGSYAPTEERAVDAAPEAEDSDAAMAPAPMPMPMCHMKCTDISAPCGCHDGACEFRQYDGAVIDVCLQMP